jgi:rRNA maturation endonuclease Nob1
MGIGNMTLMNRLKESLAAGAGNEEELYRYHCLECDTEFESTEVSTSQVECPSCGASGALSIEVL